MLYYTETVLREICQRNATVSLEKNNIRTNAEERYIFLKAEDEPVQGFCMILFLAYCEVQAIVSSMLRGKWFLTIQIDCNGWSWFWFWKGSSSLGDSFVVCNL